MPEKCLRVLDGGSLCDLERVGFGPSCPSHAHCTVISLGTAICHAVARGTFGD